MNDIFCAGHVGPDELQRIRLALLHPLERGGMHDYIDTVEGEVQPIPVADIPKQVPDAGVGELALHLRVLELVSAYHPDRPDRLAQDASDERPAEAAGAAGD